MSLPFLAISSLSLAASDFSQSAPTLEVRPVVTCEAKGASKPMRLKGSTRTLCLALGAWTNQNDVESARLERDLQGKPMIPLMLRPASRSGLVIRPANVGHNLGIVLNGELVSAPRIEEPGRGEIPIQADFTAAEAGLKLQSKRGQALTG